MKAKKCVVAILAVVIFIVMLAVEADAESRYIERNFVYGTYSPQIHIINAGLGTALEVNPDGSLSWRKLRDNNDYNDVTQYFVIIPAGNGYYAIQEMLPMGGHNPRLLTYKHGKGFEMDWPANGKIADAQRFRFKWYSSTKGGGRTIKNCWRLVCKNNIAFCRSGWATIKIIKTNA